MLDRRQSRARSFLTQQHDMLMLGPQVKSMGAMRGPSEPFHLPKVPGKPL